MSSKKTKLLMTVSLLTVCLCYVVLVLAARGFIDCMADERDVWACLDSGE